MLAANLNYRSTHSPEGSSQTDSNPLTKNELVAKPASDAQSNSLLSSINLPPAQYRTALYGGMFAHLATPFSKEIFSNVFNKPPKFTWTPMRLGFLGALVVIPFEMYATKRAVESGYMTQDEALINEAANIAIGVTSGFIGAAAGARLGVAIGSAGGFVGMAAGIVIGAGIGWGLGVLKESLFS